MYDIFKRESHDLDPLPLSKSVTPYSRPHSLERDVFYEQSLTLVCVGILSYLCNSMYRVFLSEGLFRVIVRVA